MLRMSASVVLLTFLLLTAIPSGGNAFSAHLSRPWEQPSHRGNGHVLTNAFRRKRRESYTEPHSLCLLTFTVRFTTTTTTTRRLAHDSENNINSSTDASETTAVVAENDDDDEERMVLEDSPRIFIASATSNQGQGQLHSSDSPAFHTTAVQATSTSTSQHPSQSRSHDYEPTVLSSLPKLWSMCRPSNFLGVVIFHIMGTYLALNKVSTKLVTVLMQPQQMVVLIALLLTSATSMMVNDYYDARAGIDASKEDKPMVAPRIVKRFLGFLYAALLLCTSVVPGIPARLSIVGGAMLTFLYTQHLKPITWVKTITCALLIALAPVTSGAAALSLDHMMAVTNGSHINTNNILQTLLLGSTAALSLARLVGMLFFGFLGREILMDINDVVDDRLHKIKTVPVRYGRQFASRVAFLSTLLMAGLCLLNATTATTTAAATSIGAIRNPRALAFAVLGSLAQLRRAYQVLRTDGTSRDLVSQAVEEGKLTVLLLLASFV